KRLGLADPALCATARGAAHLLDVLVVQDREQPRAKIGAVLPQMKLAEGPRQTILDEIVRRGDITRQCPGVPPQPRDLGLDALMDIAHENASHLSPLARPGGTLSGGCNRLMSGVPVLCKKL